MPDISKINALAIGSVGKVDGLAKASILDINGVTVPAAVAPPLDTYTGAAAAYSVRLLRTAYTGDIMRVRRASDNVEADVGFDGGQLKLTSPISNTSDAQSYTDLADFVDHTGTPTDAFVRWWYDQSGNSNDAGQSTGTSQPKIYDSVTGILENGAAGKEKPALLFASANSQNFLTASTQWSTAGDVALFSVYENTQLAGAQEAWSNIATRWFIGLAAQVYDGTAALNYTDALAQTVFAYTHNSTSKDIYLDGSQAATSSSPASVSTSASVAGLGRRFNVAQNYANMYMQELVIYPINQAGNRSAIETNLNDFYRVF